MILFFFSNKTAQFIKNIIKSTFPCAFYVFRLMYYEFGVSFELCLFPKAVAQILKIINILWAVSRRTAVGNHLHNCQSPFKLFYHPSITHNKFLKIYNIKLWWSGWNRSLWQNIRRWRWWWFGCFWVFFLLNTRFEIEKKCISCSKSSVISAGSTLRGETDVFVYFCLFYPEMGRFVHSPPGYFNFNVSICCSFDLKTISHLKNES